LKISLLKEAHAWRGSSLLNNPGGAKSVHQKLPSVEAFPAALGCTAWLGFILVPPRILSCCTGFGFCSILYLMGSARAPFFVWPLPFDLPGMGGPTRSWKKKTLLPALL